MNFIKTFEARIGDAFGTSPQGYTAPFSFKRLAKQAVKEMEAETFVIDGVDTAPGLFTVLVSPADDALMRSLYPQLTTEIVSFVEAQAATKGYVFVAEPLARFMVDPSLKSGKFFVFAENVDYDTLERLREEEQAFLAAAAGGGGARTERGHLSAAPAIKPQHHAGVQVMPAITEQEPVDGLDVIPSDFIASEQVAPPAVPPTQLRPQAQERPTPEKERAREADERPTPSAPPVATCLLVDKKSGRTYNGSAPKTPIGRERTQDGIVLRDPNVSRHHAELTHDGRLWRIRDLDSTNGTLVNDVDVTQCVLHDGDLITLGLTHLEFRENA